MENICGRRERRRTRSTDQNGKWTETVLRTIPLQRPHLPHSPRPLHTGLGTKRRLVARTGNAFRPQELELEAGPVTRTRNRDAPTQGRGRQRLLLVRRARDARERRPRRIASTARGQLQSTCFGHFHARAVGEHRDDERATQRQIDRPKARRIVGRIDEHRLAQQTAIGTALPDQRLRVRPHRPPDPQHSFGVPVFGIECARREMHEERDGRRARAAGPFETEPLVQHATRKLIDVRPPGGDGSFVRHALPNDRVRARLDCLYLTCKALQNRNFHRNPPGFRTR